MGVNREETDILKPFPGAFSFPHLEHPLPGRLWPGSPLSQDTCIPLALGHSLLSGSCSPGTTSQNTPPQWPRRCSSQKPLQSRLPPSQCPHGQGPLLPRDLTPQAGNPCHPILSTGSPVPHQRFGASWGPSCSGTVPALGTAGPAPCGKRNWRRGHLCSPAP